MSSFRSTRSRVERHTEGTARFECPGSSTAVTHATPFQDQLVARAKLAVGFLVRAIEACGGQGASTYYSRFYCPLRGWFWPYPETTGYIIPTLFEYAAFAGRDELAELAVRQADWILTLQYENG